MKEKEPLSLSLWETRISRRQLLPLLPVISGALWLVACGANSYVALPEPDEYPDDFFTEPWFPKTAEQAKIFEIQVSAESHETDYELTKENLSNSLASLEKQFSPSKEASAAAVLNNLGVLNVYMEKENKEEVAVSLSCVKINHLGLYLTAAHGFLSFQDEKIIGAKVIDIGAQKVYSWKKTLLSGPYDLAIFLAPTGEPDQLIENMRVSFAPFRTGQRLWQYASQVANIFKVKNYQEETKGEVGQTILSGYVDNSPEERNGLIRVRGMIPFGGSSGAPVINDRGELVAIESGFYMPPGQENLRSNYTGATVAPLTPLINLK